MSNDRDDEPFLSRWSRQKRTQPQPAAPSIPAPVDEPPFDPATLPKIDELTAESDIAAFMQKGVPEALQRLALRRMWSLDPSIRDFVEVAENQWDFNAAGGIYGLFQEIEPGADLSVWLAQAASSVTPPQKATEVVLAEADVKLAPAAAATAKLEEQPVIEQGTARDQPIEETFPAITGSESLKMDESAPTSQKITRRHGGALPV